MVIRPPVLRPDQVAEFRAAIKHNAETVKRQLAEHRLCDQDYYFVRIVKNQFVLDRPGTHNMLTARKIDDYLAGAIVGALPFNDLHGDDALMVLENGTTRLVELKLSLKDPHRYWVGQRGGLNAGEDVKGRRVGLRSDSSASYKVVHNLDKKNIDTYFVMVDSRNWKIICIYHMTGKKVMEYLTTNHNTGESKTGKERSIKLGTFATSGVAFQPEGVGVLGLEAWENLIHKRANGVSRVHQATNSVQTFWRLRNDPVWNKHWRVQIRKAIADLRRYRVDSECL